MPARRRDSLRWATRAVVLVPLAWLAVDLLGGGLGADPVGTALRRTGSSALACLLLSLALTPAVRLTGICALHAARRPLGLGAFGYAVLHLLVYVGADYGFDLSLALHSVGSSPYVLAGAAALLLLTPLAATSTDGWVRRLGRNWRRLQRLAAPAAALAVLHFGGTFKELRPLPVAGHAAGRTVILRLPGWGGGAPAAILRRCGRAHAARARPRHHTRSKTVATMAEWRNGWPVSGARRARAGAVDGGGLCCRRAGSPNCSRAMIPYRRLWRGGDGDGDPAGVPVDGRRRSAVVGRPVLQHRGRSAGLRQDGAIDGRGAGQGAECPGCRSALGRRRRGGYRPGGGRLCAAEAGQRYDGRRVTSPGAQCRPIRPDNLSRAAAIAGSAPGRRPVRGPPGRSSVPPHQWTP